MSTDYLREFRRAIDPADTSARILEIGCANGFFLEKLQQAGFTDVYGVEPGKDAVQKALPPLRSRIINDFFHPGLFPESSFDAVCCFQIFDHIPDPNRFLSDIRKVLKPDGVLLAINHNIRAFITKLLGEKSPMYDIEHICLFDKKTIRRIFSSNGFEVAHAANLNNSYTLAYAAKMFPFPDRVKRRLISTLEGSALGRWNFRVPAGNMVTVGRKRK
ncbi:MAG TPA: class I SAM-dependent methyltransferase [Bryobacteraceae bacterium]